MASNGVNGTTNGLYEATNLDKELYWPEKKLRISVTGAGGFIASHIARRLKSEGHYVIASDWKRNEHMTEDMFCDEFHLVDLRVMENCLKVTQDVEHVFNLAADMGGMGFIQSNHSVIMYNNTMISFNMLEAARINGVKRCPSRSLLFLPTIFHGLSIKIVVCTCLHQHGITTLQTVGRLASLLSRCRLDRSWHGGRQFPSSRFLLYEEDTV